MNKTVCFLVVLMLVLGAGSAVAQDCGPLNITFKPDAPSIFPGDPLYDQYVPMIATYYGLDISVFEWCWTQRVVGTIQGTCVSCGGMGLAMFDPFGLGIGPRPVRQPGDHHHKAW